MRPNCFPQEHSVPKNTAEKRTYKSKAKPKKKYAVYLNGGRYVDETMAVSEAQAVNNVRHRSAGDYIGNEGYYAVEI